MIKVMAILLLVSACGGSTGPRQVTDCCEVHFAHCEKPPNTNLCTRNWCDEGELMFHVSIDGKWWALCTACDKDAVAGKLFTGNPLVCLP